MRSNHNIEAAAHAAFEDHAHVTRRMMLASLAAVAMMTAAALMAQPAEAEPSAAGYVYTADEHGGSISRIDLKTGGTEVVPVGVMPHNVQFVPGSGLLLAVGVPASAHAHSGGEAQDHGSMSMVPAGRLLVLDAARLASEPIAVIPVGDHPAHVVADTAGKRAFVTDSEGNKVSVVDLETHTTVATIDTGRYPHGLRMSPDGRSIYVANVKDGTVSVIDVAGLRETARIHVGAAPVQVGFLPDGTRVYVSLRDENRVAVIETATLKVIGRIEVGRSPIQVHATPDGRFVYVANQGTDADPDDTVSVIDVASGTVVATIRTGAGAHGVTVSDDGAFAFVTNIVDGTVSQISIKSRSVVRSYSVGKGPNGITFQSAPAAGDAG